MALCFVLLFTQVCIWYTGKTLYVAERDRAMLFYRCLAGFSSISFAFYALSQMVLADSSVIVFTSPVFTFFLVGCLRVGVAATKGFGRCSMDFTDIVHMSRERVCCTNVLTLLALRVHCCRSEA